MKQKSEIEKLKSENSLWEERTKGLFQEIKQRDLYFEQMGLESQMKISQFQEILFAKENQIRELQENNKRLKDESKMF